jgi:hypothetical protein
MATKPIHRQLEPDAISIHPREAEKKSIGDGAIKWSQELTGGVPLADDLHFAAQTVAEEVYNKAWWNKSASKAEVILSLNVLGGISDKYGNALSNPCPMGVLVIDDLDEVRKYRDADAYKLSSAITQFYMAKLRSMQGGHLLE